MCIYCFWYIPGYIGTTPVCLHAYKLEPYGKLIITSTDVKLYYGESHE